MSLCLLTQSLCWKLRALTRFPFGENRWLVSRHRWRRSILSELSRHVEQWLGLRDAWTCTPPPSHTDGVRRKSSPPGGKSSVGIGKGAMRWNISLPRSHSTPEYVKALKTVWTEKVKLHFERFLRPIRQEGLWAWRRMSRALRKPGYQPLVKLTMIQ